MKDNIKVSVFCLAYNHEKYIRKALEGFVMQKANFAFEVLVHDDASTDGTADIIREYEEKYPDIIKPIYQVQNQYSQRIPITANYLLPKAMGEYFAWCEGDDYWTDPYKLQKQIDFLDNNPEYSICVHKALHIDNKNKTIQSIPNINSSRDFSIEEIIMGGGGIFETCSLVSRKEVYINKPECFVAKGFGDFQIFIYGASIGKCYCMNDVMATYNFLLPNSYTSTNQENKQKEIAHNHELLAMLNRINKYYNYQYDKIIQASIVGIEFRTLLLSNDFVTIKEKKYRKYYRNYLISKVKNYFKVLFPWIVKIKRKLFYRGVQTLDTKE